MPTHTQTATFQRDFGNLSRDEKEAFRAAVGKFVHDLQAGRLRKSLRVKRIQGVPGVFEMTWANEGRATFEYGKEVIEGTPHVIWRRVGRHVIFSTP